MGNTQGVYSWERDSAGVEGGRPGSPETLQTSEAGSSGGWKIVEPSEMYGEGRKTREYDLKSGGEKENRVFLVMTELEGGSVVRAITSNDSDVIRVKLPGEDNYLYPRSVVYATVGVGVMPGTKRDNDGVEMRVFVSEKVNIEVQVLNCEDPRASWDDAARYLVGEPTA